MTEPRTAARSMTDLEATDLFAKAFQHHLDEQMERNPGSQPHEYRAGGRRSKAYPDKENAVWWLDHGPNMVKMYAAWVEEMEAAGWAIWTAPGGYPAIEIVIMAMFGPVPVKMALDRVLVSPQGELVVVDLKSGARTPDSDLQLGFYACGMELNGLPRPTYGAYYMARTGRLTDIVNLDQYTVGGITDELEMFNRAVNAGIFLPKRSSHCISCGQRPNCAAQNGPNAPLYDPSHPDYQGAST